jgi:trimethylamine--corrinoid protein Co-methyltransferase
MVGEPAAVPDVVVEPRAGRRGREQRRGERLKPAAPRIRQPVRDIPVYELLDADGLETIHQASMTILAEIGIEFRDAEALELWRAAGADVKGQRVRIAPELIMAKLDLIPESFVQHARNPARSVVVGGKHMVYAPVYGSPFVRGFDGIRRYGTLEDFRNLVKLTYMMPCLQHSGGVVCEPVDVPVPKRHLDMVYSHIRYSDKPFMGMVTAPERALDSVRLAEICFGRDFVDRNTVMTSVVNCNSPLVWDGIMLGALKVYARHNQAVLITPFIMAGAMAPAATAGAIAQLNAEVVAGLAFTQLIRPGVPMVYGSFVTTVSMRSGAPMMGTPEPAHMIYACTQLARKYKVPVRTGGMLCGAKIADAQAAYESMQTMIPTLMAGTNFVLHAAGWLEAGLCAGYGKFVMDCEQIAMLQKFGRGLDLSTEGIAMDALREVGPGGHYLGCAHTMRHYTDAFFLPEVADNNSFEQWEAEGARDTDARATAIAARMLQDYEAPPLDPAIDEALQDYVIRRKSELADTVR